MQTREQQYAARIFEQVKGLPEGDWKKYGTMAHKLPVLVRTAGLVQALSFVEARGHDAQKQLLAHLAETVGENDKATLLASARTNDLNDYMRLTQKVMAALLWYKRFAQSVLGVDASEEIPDAE